jgi:hypothetical protein
MERCSSRAVFRAPSKLIPRALRRSMIVFGWRCWPARLPGKSHGLSAPDAVLRLGAVSKVLGEEFRERLWGRHWRRAKGDCDRAGGVVGVDCVRAERGHPDQGLGIEEQQYSGDSVGQGLAGADEQFPQPGKALLLREGRPDFGV